MPPPIGPSSSTTTACPSFASKYAVVIPAMPAPMMHTFALVSLLSVDSDGVSAVAAQTVSVVPEVGCIYLPFKMFTCDRQTASHCCRQLPITHGRNDLLSTRR